MTFRSYPDPALKHINNGKLVSYPRYIYDLLRGLYNPLLLYHRGTENKKQPENPVFMLAFGCFLQSDI